MRAGRRGCGLDHAGLCLAERPIEIRPTGRKVYHPRTCGSCHGAGCPEVELVGSVAR